MMRRHEPFRHTNSTPKELAFEGEPAATTEWKTRRRERRTEEQVAAVLDELYDASTIHSGFEDYETDDGYGLYAITVATPST
jgi:hypothetical protein